MKLIVRFEDVPRTRIPRVGMNNLLILEVPQLCSMFRIQRKIYNLVHDHHKNRLGTRYEVSRFETDELLFTGVAYKQ